MSEVLAILEGSKHPSLEAAEVGQVMLDPCGPAETKQFDGRFKRADLLYWKESANGIMQHDCLWITQQLFDVFFFAGILVVFH